MARGIDHLVIAVHGIDRARSVYERLGFTLTPKARHPFGTENSLVQLQGCFLEILGVYDPDDMPVPKPGEFSFARFNHRYLDRHQGLGMLVLESRDAEADAVEYAKAGVQSYLPFEFSRDARQPDGSSARVGFRLAFASDPFIPEAGFFSCQQLAPEFFWKPDYQRHANSARTVSEVVMISAAPSDHHEFFQGFTGVRDVKATSMGLTVETPRGRIRVITPRAAEAVWGDAIERPRLPHAPLRRLHDRRRGSRRGRDLPREGGYPLRNPLRPHRRCRDRGHGRGDRLRGGVGLPPMQTPPNPSVAAGNVVFANDRPLSLIAGPCAMESRGHALETAHALKEMSERLGIGLVYKSSFDKANRTSAKGARGMGLDAALGVFADIRESTGLPVVTDVHETQQCGPVAEVVDILQIPAFLCRQTDLLLAAAATGRVVNVKKGQFLAPWDMTNVVAKLVDGGNPNVLVTERGASFGYNTLVTDMRALPQLAATGAPVVFDATHSVQQPGGQGTASGGQREFVPVLARAAVAIGVAGVFIETHPDPDKALSDGPNMVPMRDLPELVETLMEFDRLSKARPLS